MFLYIKSCYVNLNLLSLRSTKQGTMWTFFVRENILSLSSTSKRMYHHARPVIKYNLTKPEVNLSKFQSYDSYSPLVKEFIEARSFENDGGRQLEVKSFLNGTTVGQVEVNDFVFSANPRIDILHRNMVWYRTCIRAGTASVKSRAEVRGGGKKPWPQKGTGRARHGSIRSPIWRKGGSAKPIKPRDYSYNLPYKVRRLGLRTALSFRLAQTDGIRGDKGDLFLVDSLKDLPSEERHFQEIAKEYGLENALFVDGFENTQLEKITRNLKETNEYSKIDSTHALFLHVYGILVRHKLVLSLEGLRLLEDKLCEDNRKVTDPKYELYQDSMLLDKSLLYEEYDPRRQKLAGRFIRDHLDKKIIENKLKRMAVKPGGKL